MNNRAKHSEENSIEINQVILWWKKKLACLAKARGFHTLPNIRMLCLDEGFKDLEICYVGGLWVLVRFKSKHACKCFFG